MFDETNAPLDTSVPLPRALRARVTSADAALKGMREGRAPEQPQDRAQQPQEGPKPEQATRQPDQPQSPPAAGSEQQRQSEQRQSEQRQSSEGEPWEQRFRSLQGQFDPLKEENRRLRQENDGLRESMSSLEGRLSALEGARLPEGEGQPQTFDIAKVLTDDERNEWGEDFVGMMDRVAKAATGPLEAENKRLRERLDKRDQSEQTRTQAEMHDYLDKSVPDWEDINREEAFVKDWLAKTDEASGLSRQKLLQTAYSRNEALRVAWFFKQYLSEKDGASPEAQQGRGQGRAAAPKTLEQFAAPGKGRTATDTPQRGDEDAPMIPLSEYVRFGQDRARGRLKMTTADIERRSAELDRAYNEGRIDMSK